MRLFDFGIHKNGAAGAQIDRVFRLEAQLRELVDAQSQRMSEAFDKGTATGGTGLVEDDGVNDAILYAKAFHVLSADIKHRGNVGRKLTGGLQVRYGFDFADIDAQSRFDIVLPIAGDR